MIKAIAVIGANYGDEGKGLATDFFASQDSNSLVVRFNGGAQAGHTVAAPDGRRHVFHHFGSGSFCDVPTYLSEYFILNPLLWQEERKDLEKLGVQPKMFLNYNSPVSTPYDMLLNRLIESSRGKDAHGSVGVGIFETLNREICGFSLRLEDLYDDSYVAIALDEIWNRYIPDRLRQVGLDITHIKNWDRAKINQAFTVAAQEMIVAHDVALDLSEFQKQTIIFEGAQGLGLDQNYGEFPFVTPSNCGITNPLNLLEEAFGFEDSKIQLEAHYVSRTYVTRHGNGPLVDETKVLGEMNCLTNQPNEWQGNLRFAPLNAKSFAQLIQRLYYENCTIDNFLPNVKANYQLSRKLFMTHLDQVPIFSAIKDKLISYTSSGPTRNDVQRSHLHIDTQPLNK